MNCDCGKLYQSLSFQASVDKLLPTLNLSLSDTRDFSNSSHLMTKAIDNVSTKAAEGDDFLYKVLILVILVMVSRAACSFCCCARAERRCYKNING